MIVAGQAVLGYGISSRAIGYFGGMNLSHFDIMLPDGSLLGARSDWIKPLNGGPSIPPGVQIRPSNYERWRRQIVFRKMVPDAWAQDFYARAHAQVDKPYDSTAIWGFATGRDWRDPDKWFCSELWIWLCEQAHLLPLLQWLPVYRIMPGTAAVASQAGGFDATIIQG